jgi:acetyl esterase/lipase
LLRAASAGSPAPREAADFRRAAAALAEFAAPAPDVSRAEAALPAEGRVIPSRVYRPGPSGDASLPALVYFHGGGWVSGDLETHDAICAWLCHFAQCAIVAVAYRLAPESRFPAARDDAWAAVAAVVADPARFGIDAARIGVGGDSAGAGLAAAAAREARDRGVALALQLLLCPVLDPLPRAPSRREFAEGFLLEEATMARYWELYRAEGLSPDDSRVTPSRAADLSGLPPAIIHCAEFDPVRDEGEFYARALAEAGVRVHHRVHRGLIHHFYGLGAVIPAGQTALATIGANLRAGFAGEWDAAISTPE